MSFQRTLQLRQQLFQARTIRPLGVLSTSTYPRVLLRSTLSRLNSNLTPPLASSIQSAVQSPYRRQRRPNSYRILIAGTIAVIIGLAAGNAVRLYLAPPPLPIPSTTDDSARLIQLNSAAAALPIVKELRLHSDEWSEWTAYSKIPNDEKGAHLTAGSMAGSRGLGVNIVFWNEKEHRSLSVIHFGGALTGWPGVTHGGAIATIMLENLERVASDLEPSLSGKSHGLAETMQLKYRTPTRATSFYVIRAEVDEASLADGVSGSRIVKATLENVEKGTLCVEATARCRTSDPEDSVLRESERRKQASSFISDLYRAIGSIFN